jgi:predicted kinase
VMPEFRTALAIICGLPLSGKSTFVRQLRREMPWVVVCPDEVRLALHGSEFLKPAEGLVWASTELMVRAMLRSEQMVLIDATNTTKTRRNVWVDIADDFGLPLAAYVMDTPAHTCKDRALAANKEHMVPIIERMAEQWEDVDEYAVETVSFVRQSSF